MRADVTKVELLAGDLSRSIPADAHISQRQPNRRRSNSEVFALASGAAENDVLLAARGIRKSFRQKQVLDRIDLELHSGEHLAIIGPSGGGKSTLIRCLNLLETPDDGEVIFAGKPIWTSAGAAKESALRAHRLKVGMVFQSFNLFTTYTALQNVSLAQIYTLHRSRAEADQRSRELLGLVGLAEHLDKHPSQLSGGQQQRVAIARALAMDPKVMLFDEPTSAIDPEMRIEVLAVMKDLAARGMAMIAITHEFKFAEHFADRVIFLADSRIIEEGTPAQIFTSPKHERTRRFVADVSGDV